MSPCQVSGDPRPCHAPPINTVPLTACLSVSRPDACATTVLISVGTRSVTDTVFTRRRIGKGAPICSLIAFAHAPVASSARAARKGPAGVFTVTPVSSGTIARAGVSSRTSTPAARSRPR